MPVLLSVNAAVSPGAEEAGGGAGVWRREGFLTRRVGIFPDVLGEEVEYEVKGIVVQVEAKGAPPHLVALVKSELSTILQNRS